MKTKQNVIAVQTQQSNHIKYNNQIITQYLQYITVKDLLDLYDADRIEIRRWTLEDKDGFQRIDNLRHIKGIAKYLTEDCILMPQNIIMNNISESKLSYDGELLILNKDTKLSLSDGQHRLLSFKLIIDDINKILCKFEKETYLNRLFENKVDFKYLEEYKEFNEDSTVNVNTTRNNLENLLSYLENYPLSCCIYDKLTEALEAKMFFNLNTKA